MSIDAGSQPQLSLARFSRACTLLALALFALFLTPWHIALAQPGGGSVAVPVAAVRPMVRELVEYDEYTGRFAAVNRIDLRARVSGYLSAAEFTEGQLVQAGDLLFVIDQRPFQIAVRAARAELEEMRAGLDLARTEADRARTLRKDLVISQEDLDHRVQAEVVAASRLSRAQATLALCRRVEQRLTGKRVSGKTAPPASPVVAADRPSQRA